MPLSVKLRSFLKNLFWSRRAEIDLDQEIHSYLEMLTEENIRAGLPPSEAQREARIQLGGIEQVKGQVREERVGSWVHTMISDCRYGVRRLRKNPGFTVVAVLTLALGIGANTAIFSVVHAVLLKSLPYPDPDRLMILSEYSARNGSESVSWMDYLDWRQQNHSFEEMAAYNMSDFNFTGVDKPEVVRGGRVTSSFFSLVGAHTVLGRTFTPEEDQAGAKRTAVLTYTFWRQRLGGDPTVLGKSLTLEGEPYTVIGVLGPTFQYFSRHIDLCVPAGLWATPETYWLQRGNHEDLTVLARLRPGSSIQRAQSDMNMIMARLEKEYPASNEGQRANVTPLYRALFGDTRPVLFTLLGGVVCVLLIACANVANLSIARGAGRQKEFAVRAAIGAGRPRIIFQLLTESVLLSLAGGLLGLFLARWSIGSLLRLAPADIPRLSGTRIDAVVFLFSFGVALLTGVVSGLAPAFRASRVDVRIALRETDHSTTAGRRSQRLRTGLLICEVAVAVVLVIASGLLTRSLLKVLAVNPGFRADHLLAVDINLPHLKYKTDPQQLTFLNDVLERTRRLPGVQSASAVLCPPLVGTCWDSVFFFDDRPVPATAELPRAVFNIADLQYFQVVGVPLLQGRQFTTADTKQSPLVVVINETAARRWFPHASPLGKRINQGFATDKKAFREIVGVVGDLRQDGPDQEQWPEVFEPETQNTMPSFTLMVRTVADPMAMAGKVESVIYSVDPDQPAYHVKAMTQYLAESLARRKFLTLLLILFSALALVLAAVGIYGVISYTVAQRTHEIGIRMALGAERSSVARMVLRQGASLALTGAGIGMVTSLATAWCLASLLYGIAPYDPVVFFVAPVALLGVALLGSYLPARRAMRTDPMVALRYE